MWETIRLIITITIIIITAMVSDDDDDDHYYCTINRYVLGLLTNNKQWIKQILN